MKKVRYPELLPHEFRSRLAELPVAYLPLGTLEWHGEHLPIGADAIQSEALMVECARQLGGIAMPPIYFGPDRASLTDNGSCFYGMDTADSTTPHRQLDGSCYWISNGMFETLIDAMLSQIKRAGFRGVFADGHGPSRWVWTNGIDEREKRFGLKLLGVTHSDVANGWSYQVDHAARNETSITLVVRGDLVDLSQLPDDRAVWPQGVGGEDPRDATTEWGRECLQSSVEVVRRKLDAAGL